MKKIDPRQQDRIFPRYLLIYDRFTARMDKEYPRYKIDFPEDLLVKIDLYLV